MREPKRSTEVGQRWVQLPLGLGAIEEVFGTAHNVKLDPSHRRPDGPWLDVWPCLEDVAAHVEKGGLFGSVPNTFVLSDGLHLSALDVDRGDASKLAAAYPALASVPSWQPGRMHFYYPDKESRSNSDWAFGDVGGEVRSANGYLAHYRTGPLELATAISRWPNGPRCTPFPANLVRTPRTHQDQHLDVARRPHALALGCPIGLKPLAKFRDVAIGQRHPTLVRAASRWAGRQTWNGRTLDDAWLVQHLWRLAIGMRDRLPDDEVAGLVGWAVSMRPIFKAMPHSAAWRAQQARRGRHGGLASKGGGRPRKWASEAERLRAYRAAHTVRKQANGRGGVEGAVERERGSGERRHLPLPSDNH